MVSDIQVLMAWLLTHTAFVTKRHQALSWDLTGFPSSRWEGARGLSLFPVKTSWKANVEHVGVSQVVLGGKGQIRHWVWFDHSSKGEFDEISVGLSLHKTSSKLEPDEGLEETSSMWTQSKDFRKVLFWKSFMLLKLLYPFLFHLSCKRAWIVPPCSSPCVSVLQWMLQLHYKSSLTMSFSGNLLIVC